LIEFEFDDFAQEEIRRLEQLRLAVEEDRVEALLRLGRHADVVGRLESLVGAHPLRERLRGQWMVALYRSGRQADALDAYRDGRRLLADELGLDPAPELQRLERAILGQDEALDAPARPELSRPPPSDVPATSARRRRPLLLLGALLPLAALLGIGAYALVRDREHTAASLPDTPPALVGIDARTNRIVAAVPLGSRPAAVAASPAALWVGDAADGTVTQIDPRSRRVVRTIGIGAPAIDLATDARNLWVATGGFGVVVRIDTGIGAVADRFELGDPADPVVPAVSSIGVSNHRVWVGAFNGIALLDPRTGEITRRVDLGHAPALQLATGGGAVWATLLTRRAKRVDARSMKETAEFYTGTFAFAIARDSSAVWLAGAYGGQLWKFDPVTGATLLTARAGGGADGIALGAGSVWISSSVDHAIVRVDPATGVVLATIPIRGEPEDLLVRDGIVWVTVQTPRGPG
jgi:streptogramin lyase